MKKHKILKGALALSAAAGGAYLGIGGLFYSQLLTKTAASRNLKYLPDGDVLAGKYNASGEERGFSFVEKLFNAEAGFRALYDSPGFPAFQEGIRWFVESGPETVAAESPLGGRIYAELIRGAEACGIWAICLHGYTGSVRDTAGIARVFCDEWGFNVLMPHLRAHGKSEAADISMGWLDRLELIAWISYLNREYNNPPIILHGTSMGAATVMMATGEELPPNVICAVEDCGFTSAREMFELQAKNMFRLPPVFVDSLDIIMRLRQGFASGEASALEQVKKSKTPTLFIHGEADAGVPFSMLDALYEAAACEKERLTVAGAGHGECKTLEPELYFGTIRSFISKYIAQVSHEDNL